MSNNKQSMKLYTEEQMHTVMLLALGRYEIHSNRKVLKENHDLIDSLTPIELPSDEEIEEYADNVMPYAEKIGGETYTAYRAIKLGAKWMLNKIQGGNK